MSNPTPNQPNDTMNEFDKELAWILHEFRLQSQSYTAEQAIKQAVDKHVIPKVETTIEEFDERNSHLNSRTKQSAHDYNRGYIDATLDIRQSLWGKR